ncbi:MAG: hypothetical protein ACI93R_003541 [Flavobacteriales bacterium]
MRGSVQVRGTVDGQSVQENRLPCSVGRCESALVYAAGTIQYRLGGDGISGTYSPSRSEPERVEVYPQLCSPSPSPTPTVGAPDILWYGASTT